MALHITPRRFMAANFWYSLPMNIHELLNIQSIKLRWSGCKVSQKRGRRVVSFCHLCAGIILRKNEEINVEFDEIYPSF